jgi:hypothetical protein
MNYRHSAAAERAIASPAPWRSVCVRQESTRPACVGAAGCGSICQRMILGGVTVSHIAIMINHHISKGVLRASGEQYQSFRTPSGGSWQLQCACFEAACEDQGEFLGFHVRCARRCAAWVRTSLLQLQQAARGTACHASIETCMPAYLNRLQGLQAEVGGRAMEGGVPIPGSKLHAHAGGAGVGSQRGGLVVCFAAMSGVTWAGKNCRHGQVLPCWRWQQLCARSPCLAGRRGLFLARARTHARGRICDVAHVPSVQARRSRLSAPTAPQHVVIISCVACVVRLEKVEKCARGLPP